MTTTNFKNHVTQSMHDELIIGKPNVEAFIDDIDLNDLQAIAFKLRKNAEFWIDEDAYNLSDWRKPKHCLALCLIKNGLDDVDWLALASIVNREYLDNYEEELVVNQ